METCGIAPQHRFRRRAPAPHRLSTRVVLDVSDIDPIPTSKDDVLRVTDGVVVLYSREGGDRHPVHSTGCLPEDAATALLNNGSLTSLQARFPFPEKCNMRFGSAREARDYVHGREEDGGSDYEPAAVGPDAGVDVLTEAELAELGGPPARRRREPDDAAPPAKN
eukprot:gene14673-22282_t